MHVIFSQFSGLVGLFVFLSQLWRYVSLDKAVFTAIGAALAVYLILLVGDILIRRILAYPTTPALAGGPARAAAHETKTRSSRQAAKPASGAETLETERVAAL